MEYSNEFYQAILNQFFKQLDSNVVIDAVVVAMNQVPIERRYSGVKQSKRIISGSRSTVEAVRSVWKEVIVNRGFSRSNY